MLAIRVDYLTGRVCAADFDSGDRKLAVEWPPHPSRLFSALVAAWGEADQDPTEREALEQLESEPPEIWYVRAGGERRFTAFVPVNDRVLEEKLGAGLVESRERKSRAFVSAQLLHPTVYFVWPRLELSEAQARVLDRLLARVPYLGHSSSLVQLSRAIPEDSGYERLCPGEPGWRRLRVPYPGRLQELCELYQRFRQNPIKQFRPTRGETMPYGYVTQKVAPVVPQSIFELVMLRRVSGELLGLRGTLQLTAAARRRAMQLGPQPSPEYLSGHAPQSTPESPARSERDHLGWVPLAYVGSPHADGRILGLAALVPRTLSKQERAVCYQVLGKLRSLELAGVGSWQIEPVTADDPRLSLRLETWVGPAQHWASVTPFVFDRFPKSLYSEEAHEVVRAACERIGLPRPIQVTVTMVSPHVGVPPAFSFPRPPVGPGKPPRPFAHVILSFASAVYGPVAIGAGRYYGYGFCKPWRS